MLLLNPTLGPVWLAEKPTHPPTGKKPVTSVRINAAEEHPAESELPAKKLHRGMLFRYAAPLWLRTQKAFTSPATYRRKRHQINPLTAFFGELRLEQVADADLLREYQEHRLEAGCGPDGINHELGIVRELLRRVGLWKQVEPDYRRIPVQPSTVGRALSADEVKQLFSAAKKNPEWEVAYLVATIAANTVLSPTEIFRRTLSEVDLASRMIYVSRGKNRFRVRSVPMNEHAYKAAATLMARAKQLGATKPDHHLLPYRGRVGVNWDPTQPARGCRTAWRKLTREVGMRGLRIKDLRHHGTTVLDEHGVSTRTIKSLLGHSPNSRIIETYSHPRVQARRKAVKVLEKTLPRV